ncbi:CapA family protein [Blautia sp.]|uniref:CapA family protein n=1 Tax=Blautia sp. TaxID=1955243 RepID=UPI00257F13C8|nr:CapA family protein [Blautia sp.]
MNKEQQRRNARRRRKRRRRMSYRQKIVYMQITLITVAIFLGLLVGAAALTKVMNNRQAQNSEKTASQEQQEETTEPKKDDSSTDNTDDTSKDSQEETTTPEPTAESVSITVSMVGDCTLGTDVNFDQSTSFDAFYQMKNDPGYFFQNVKDIFTADDLTVANMEGTLTTSNDRQQKTFAFKGDPSYTEILTRGGVEATNLANNHSHDYGDQSYEDTIQYLEAAGITTFGYDRTAVMDVKGIKVGLIGIYELKDGLGRQQQVIDTIQEVKDQGAQVIIVSFHWGTEKSNVPDDIQKTLAHLAVDQGADLVVGHHPHVLQGIEKYQGKNIVYSLGNFCFGGNKNPSDKDTMIFQQTFTVENGELVEDDVTNIIPCSLSSESGYNNYQPMVLEGSEKERVLQKIEEFSAALNQ